MGILKQNGGSSAEDLKAINEAFLVDLREYSGAPKVSFKNQRIVDKIVEKLIRN